MLHKFLNDFLALAPLQLPELINQERMEQPVYEDGYVLLDFKLEKSYSLEEVMNLLEDQMELIILYHKVTSVHTEFGQFCCAFSNPNFGRMYKMNASTDANGNVHSIIVLAAIRLLTWMCWMERSAHTSIFSGSRMGVRGKPSTRRSCILSRS